MTSTPTAYETTAGHVTRAGTYHKLLDLLDQLISLAAQMAPPDTPRAPIYARMLAVCDSLIDSAAVIAHLHNTETTARDHALNSGWLAVSHAFQTIRNVLTAMTQARTDPRAWLDMSAELRKIKHKTKSLAERTLN